MPVCGIMDGIVMPAVAVFGIVIPGGIGIMMG
jgi:hypothetical protein